MWVRRCVLWMPARGSKAARAGAVAGAGARQERTRGSGGVGEAETRISKLEDDTAAQGEIRDSLRSQIEDAQWKMADLENRAWQNNL
ncbi:hypothetical protein NDU88_001005 [Pleurodeles waltl]|uniref:Uncharacterized protein n=1 Tax=Pleurodeles waltl TaxID=8319 RepID=A0AAV7WH49_PLEWA|nr:hypothetical protein NDU88_001005 [Pleurodeles waltl]